MKKSKAPFYRYKNRLHRRIGRGDELIEFVFSWNHDIPNDCIPTGVARVLGGSREPSRMNNSTRDADERRGK